MSKMSALARVFSLGTGGRGRPFGVVCADPPWMFGDQLPGVGRGAAKNYDVLSVDDVKEGEFVGGHLLDLVADDAYLFLWRVSAMVEEAYEVVRAWDFVPKTEVVWRKQTVRGMRHFGMGWHLRAEHETCIVATRGKPKPLVRNIRSVFDAPTPGRADGKAVHSAKPETFYTEVVEKLHGGPYLELFARARRASWTCVGDEL